MTWNFANGQKITAGSFYGGTETHTVTSVSVPPAGSYDGVVNAGSSTPSGDLGFQATRPGGTNAVPALDQRNGLHNELATATHGYQAKAQQYAHRYECNTEPGNHGYEGSPKPFSGSVYASVHHPLIAVPESAVSMLHCRHK